MLGVKLAIIKTITDTGLILIMDYLSRNIDIFQISY